MKNEKELFEEIENVLHAYEDAYTPGAWEEFVKKKKRPRGLIFIRIAAAAAVLLMLGYAAWLFVPSTPVDTENRQTKNTTKPPYIYPEKKPGHDSLTTDLAVVPPKSAGDNVAAPSRFAAPGQPVIAEQLTGHNGADEKLPVINRTDKTGQPARSANIAEISIPKKDSAAVVTNMQPLNNTNAPAIATTDAPSAVKPEPRRYERGTQRLNYDSLASLNKPKTLPADNKKSKSISYALLVSPSVGNQKMNFGTGVEVAYNINKNFSVSSGVSYAYVNAGSNRNGVPADATQNLSMKGYNASFSAPSTPSSFSNTNSSQTVQGVRLALSGLEIPLSFQYKTAGGFYLSAGVSAMSVIGNNLSYNYINNRSVSTPSANGFASTISVITEETTERSNENLSGYIGFYTFSAGKKVSFGRGKLNFAPFIKIPFNRVSSESIQLMHGGIQLGIGF